MPPLASVYTAVLYIYNTIWLTHSDYLQPKFHGHELKDISPKQEHQKGVPSGKSKVSKSS